jgi:hypothetical protein
MSHDRFWHEADHLHLSINLVGYPGAQRKLRDRSVDSLLAAGFDPKRLSLGSARGAVELAGPSW